MMYRGSLALIIMLVFVVYGCNKKQPEQAKQLQPLQELVQAHGAATASSVAGIKWSVPQRWTVLAPRQMRVATYGIAAAGGDQGSAECGVFYFGAEQGGSVDANIERWISQFEVSNPPVRTSKEVNGLKVSFVQVAGTYLAPGGPMMQPQGKMDNFRLLGAIAEAPQGSVFFKLTGPAKTVAAAENDFNTLVSSLEKQ